MTRNELDGYGHELMECHSHRCPACSTWWGCMRQPCEDTPAHYCFDCDPQVVDCEHGYHWRLKLDRVESIDCPRPTTLRIRFRDSDATPVISNPSQVTSALTYLATRLRAGDSEAVRLWRQLSVEAVRHA